jgi:NTE family protein
MDWIDEADGVFRGGGVKGIALAGALEGFASHPTKPVRRWVNVAGASAGAIIACYLALGRTATEMSALLRDTDFSSFQDFPRGSPVLGVANLAYRRGLARGRAFERWFDDVLGGATFAQVRKAPEGDKERDWHLKLIAVDVTRRDLLVLPDDLDRYLAPGTSSPIDPDGFRIARAARMSMSIPYFFEPVELEHRDGGPSAIIDGGTLSNFPVWLFDVDPAKVGRPPRAPHLRLHPHRRARLRRRRTGGAPRRALVGALRVRHLRHRTGGLGRALRVAIDPCAHASRRCGRRSHHRLPDLE